MGTLRGVNVHPKHMNFLAELKPQTSRTAEDDSKIMPFWCSLK